MVHPATVVRRPRPRRGMSMIEVVVAVIILGGALLSMGMFVTNYARTTRSTNARALAGQLVSTRLEEIKTWNNYYTLMTQFTATETGVLTGYNRRTYTRQVGGNAGSKQDHILVTVAVYGKAIPDTIKNTIAIPRF
jgi:prepilin-type N-terminal cleavage/methylation domain-containing protein